MITAGNLMTELHFRDCFFKSYANIVTLRNRTMISFELTIFNRLLRWGLTCVGMTIFVFLQLIHNDMKQTELIVNPDGSIFHLHLLPGDIADNIIIVGDPGSGGNDRTAA